MPAPLPYSCTFPESAGPFQFFSSGHTTKQPTMHKHSALCALGPDATRPATPPAWPTRTRVVASRFGGERRERRQKPAGQERTVCLRRLLSDQQRRRYFRQRAARLRAAACCTLHALEALTPGRPGVPPPVRPLPPSRTELVDRESPDHAIGEEDARDSEIFSLLAADPISVFNFLLSYIPLCPAKNEKIHGNTRAKTFACSFLSLSLSKFFFACSKKIEKHRGSYGITAELMALRIRARALPLSQRGDRRKCTRSSD